MEEPNAPQISPTPSTPALLPRSTLATISLVAAILGLTFAPGIGSIIALVTGYMARKETRSVPPVASGDGLATAGIIMGWIEIGLAVIGICCYMPYVFFVARTSLQAQ